MHTGLYRFVKPLLHKKYLENQEMRCGLLLLISKIVIVLFVTISQGQRSRVGWVGYSPFTFLEKYRFTLVHKILNIISTQSAERKTEIGTLKANSKRYILKLLIS